MTTLRFLTGVVLIVIVVGPIAVAAVSLRRVLLPRWAGPPARLVEIVLVAAGVVVLSELLGAVGLYRLAAVVTVFPVAAALTWWWASRARRHGPDANASPGRGGGPPAPDGPGRTATVVAIAVVAAAVASWSTWTIEALRHGVVGIDTLWYHLPIVARFLQTGSMTAVHYINGDPDTAFVPVNSELFHGLGIMLAGSDVFSTVLNLGWLAVALLAGWCIGRPYGVAPVAMAAVAVVATAPMLVSSQPGGALADIFGLALVLVAVAVVVNAESAGGLTRRATLVAALAGGLAIGAKYTLLGVVGALTIAVIVAARPRQRARVAVVWLAGLIATGSFWYLRNAVRAGNPLPPLGVDLGPLTLSPVRNQVRASTFSEFVSDGGAWRDHFFPGLRDALGPAWIATLALMVAGVVVAAKAGPGRLRRALGGVALAAVAAYVVTPQNMAIFGVPLWFKFQVRWLAPAIALGLVLLSITPALTTRARAMGLLGVYAAIVGSNQLDSAVWPTNLFARAFAEPVRGAESRAGVALGLGLFVAGVAWVRAPKLRSVMARHSTAFVLVASAGLVCGGTLLHHQYIERRFADRSARSLARDLHDERIGFVGLDLQQYPWYGPDLSNHVQFVGPSGAQGRYGRFETCPEWRKALNNGRYSYVIIAPSRVGQQNSAEQRWTERDPHVSLVRRTTFSLDPKSGTDDVPISLYRIDGGLDPNAC